MNVKPIKSAAAYDEAIRRIEQLIDSSPGSDEADELEVLAVLAEKYEEEFFPFEEPNPIEAIRFRMDQEGLTAKDLEPYLGTRSRVSEVLSGARPLSIDMIRALHEHLAIPAHVLIGKDGQDDHSKLSAAAERLLTSWNLKGKQESLNQFLARAFGSFGSEMTTVMYRKTRTARTNVKTDQNALNAWCAAAAIKSQKCQLSAEFEQAKIDSKFLRSIASLSAKPNGPQLVAAELSSFGIAFVTVPHLPNTFLDGAAMCRSDGVPLVALTLRRDRVDNFWFTLLHELAHLKCAHLSAEKRIIVDDLELGSNERIEEEADRVASDALVPPHVWASFNRGPYCSLDDVLEASRLANVNPAIIAGRWQRENKDFRKFSKLLGHNTVRVQVSNQV